MHPIETEHAFGAWLRRQRRALDLTQEELARQVGCSAITLRKLEAEERRPSKQIAERLAEVLQVPPGERADFLRFARGDPFAAPGAATAAGPASPASPAPHHNLPHSLTRFIGRERETSEITALLGAERLVTLTGTGGTGKTRLALAAAAGLLEAFADGVWLVELAALAEPALLPQTVAKALGLRELAGTSITVALSDHLRPKRLLLLLDNCEHLIQACAELAMQLLSDCPQLTILATGRQALGLAGERAYVVPTLTLPAAGQRLSLKILGQSEAVRLFLERASAAQPRFSLTDDNAAAVAEICRELDGIPLALELAAARLRLLSVEQIAARLDDRFRLLIGGSRAALPRHQTLQALIDWSYDLLPPVEQVLLQRLAVFAGGWTLEAAEWVGGDDEGPLPATKDERPLYEIASQGKQGAGDEEIRLAKRSFVLRRADVLNLLGRLIDQSLVQVDVLAVRGGPRYHLLETIRQYALARLLASGAIEAVRQKHAAYYQALWDRNRVGVHDLTQQEWLDPHEIERELDNVRAALTWSQSALGDAELGLRLSGAVPPMLTGFAEARGWLAAALARAEAEPIDHPQARAVALARLGALVGALADYDSAHTHLTHSLAIFQALGDQLSTGWVLEKLGWVARERGDAATARLRLTESLAIVRQLDDKLGMAIMLNGLGEVALSQGESAEAARLLTDSLALHRAMANTEGIGWSLNHLAQIAQLQGEYERAARLHLESLTLFQAINDQYPGIGEAHQGLGEAALSRRRAPLALQHFRQALARFAFTGARAQMAWSLNGLAGVATLDEEPERAARLWGAADALRRAIHARQVASSQPIHARLMAEAREQLGAATFDAAWAQGQTLTLEQALALATDAA